MQKKIVTIESFFLSLLKEGNFNGFRVTVGIVKGKK